VGVAGTPATAKSGVDWRGFHRQLDLTMVDAGAWGAITPNVNINAAAGFGYFKDALGFVSLRGNLVNNTGGAVTNLVTTTPLGAGLRPANPRIFAVGNSAGTVTFVQVDAGGGITVVFSSLANTQAVYLDGLRWMGEA
jgi:hypothetical protein